MSSIKWLCRVADEEAFAAASAAVLAVPNVPPAAVRMLTAAGVRVSNAAVMAAALKQQLGAEDWVCARVQQLLHMATLAAQLRSPAGTLQIAAAVATAAAGAAAAGAAAAGAAAAGAAGQAPLLGLLDLCDVDGQYVELPWLLLYFMHPMHMPDLLRMALNQRDEAIATAVAGYLVCEDTDLCDRAYDPLEGDQEFYKVSLLDDQQGAQQPDAAAQLQRQQAVKVQLLASRSQQLQQVSPQLLNELLLLAAARQHSRLIEQLLLLPGAQQLHSSTVAALLRRAVCSHSNKLHPREQQLELLCQLPAAADIRAEQLAGLLLEAVTRQQLMSTYLLQDLPAAAQLSSAQVKAIALPAVRSGWWTVLGGGPLDGLLHQLTPQHYYELLHEAVLVATFAGAGMLHMWCGAHCGAPVPASMDEALTNLAEPAASDALEVIKVLCIHEAAVDVAHEHVEQLLLTAAALGNAGALAVLSKHMSGVPGVEKETHLQLLETALQLRNSSVAQVAAARLWLGVDWDGISEAVMGLVRTDDRQQLHRVGSTMRMGWASKCMYEVLQMALQLRRGGLVACLLSKRWSSPPAAAGGSLSAKHLTADDVAHLLRLAVRNSCHRAVQQLLQLPAAACLPYGGLMLVEEERSMLGKLQQACGSSAAVWWSRRSRWAVLVPLRPPPQHQQCSSVQQTQPADQQQLAQLAGPQQQAQLELDVDSLLEAMMSGQHPSSTARAMLLRVGAAPRASSSLSDEEWHEVWEVHDLLKAAVEQVPAGQLQQAWVALLAQSQFVAHVLEEDADLLPDPRIELLLAAVHAACVSSWTASLRVLCQAWPDVSSKGAYQMTAAAVQLGCLPVLQLLLTVPAVQALTAGEVTSLLRWGIHSSSRGVLGDTKACVLYGSSTCTQPPPPGCTAAHAEVFAAVCKLPAVQQVAGVQLVGLLLRAMQQGNVEAVQQLCRLAGAQQLDTALVRGCLCFARVVGSRPGREAVVGALCSLSGAQGLRAADVGELLQLYGGVDALMGWAAAESEEAGVEPAEVRLTRAL
uniref:Uncharacterized protein n=1 Tax=Tetradesmus obliquus TaxID=3088 RepID=A0A383VEW7_TETOB|eukprot:jgi/Sobl393_1/5687/SZX62926.1